MAIYHLSATVISRSRGQSVVAAAAYRCGAALRDQRYGIRHRQPRSRRVEHAEILAPDAAPAWTRDRQLLWNRVEEGERRKDAQLARAVEIGLPAELSPAENLALVRAYVAREFIARGMVADLCIGWNGDHPWAHILLTLRPATASGFGRKERLWNRRALLQEWRASWADLANEHLARAGHGVRIDHRTLEAQQNLLTPGRRIGIARPRQTDDTLPTHLAERIVEQQRVADANGAAILEDPTLLLRALTHERPIFTPRDLAKFLRSRTHGEAQFESAYARVIDSGELVELPPGGAAEPRSGGPPSGEPRSDAPGSPEPRFTTRDMLEAERSLHRRITAMAGRRRSPAAQARSSAAVTPDVSLSAEHRRAFDYLTGDGLAKAMLLASDPEPSALLAALHGAWKAAGLSVRGAAPSPRAARELEAASGIACSTWASREADFARGVDPPPRDSILLLVGVETMALKQLERLVAGADAARAEIVLLGDAARLQGMKVEPAFAGVLRRIGPHDAARRP